MCIFIFLSHVAYITYVYESLEWRCGWLLGKQAALKQKGDLKQLVLRLYLKYLRDGELVTESGMLFQTLGEATEKASLQFMRSVRGMFKRCRCSEQTPQANIVC